MIKVDVRDDASEKNNLRTTIRTLTWPFRVSWIKCKRKFKASYPKTAKVLAAIAGFFTALYAALAWLYSDTDA